MANNCKCKSSKADKKYRGVEIDCADDNRVSETAVEADVRELNNNPRNDDDHD